jgi:hypothetical protein
VLVAQPGSLSLFIKFSDGTAFSDAKNNAFSIVSTEQFTGSGTIYGLLKSFGLLRSVGTIRVFCINGFIFNIRSSDGACL